MESNSKEGNSGKPRETVTLVLKEERFEVEKQKLIDKSQYFAALLSSNFLEYGQTEHVINYDISSSLLQDFIGWTHDKIAFTSATSYDFEELDRLLSLLELGIIFAADKLIEDITDKLERHFMLPIYAIKIWLLAQKFNINVLRDLSLAVCLDRFDELPLDSIYELSKEHFMKLIENINLRATESHLLDITREWMNHHHDSTIPLYILEKKQKILQGIISCEDNNGEQYIHCWDGNDFFQLTSFKYPPDIVEHSSTSSFLEGMQITARRYQLYLCGGEYGIGSGIFNKNVWRYSMISKKWILETVMPVERRDMITVFLKDKLHIVGGVGRDQQKLNTIDIYDISTGLWTLSGAKIPYMFFNVPQHFIFNDKLIIVYQYYSFIYFPDEDIWANQVPLYSIRLYSAPSDAPILMLKTMSCYIDVADRDTMVLKTITETCNVEGCNSIIKIFSYPTKKKSARVIYDNPRVHEIFSENNDRYFFGLIPFFREYGEKMEEKPAVLLCSDLDDIVHNKHRTLHLHSIPIRDPRKLRSLFFTEKNSVRRFFNLHILHPAHLHTTNLDSI